MENFNTLETTRRDDSVVATLMRNVYLWMTLALVITGLTGAYVAKSQEAIMLIFGNRAVFWGILIAELALVFGLSAAIERLSFTVATLMFIVYSIVNGLTLSCIFLVYELGSIGTIFFTTAATFGGLAIFGTTTKKDLSPIGKFCFIGLLGIIVAGIVNLFLHNTMADFVINAIGVVVFAGLTAYDSQKIQQMLSTAGEVNDSTMKLALIGALSLYLDFINLFLKLLSLFGKRR